MKWLMHHEYIVLMCLQLHTSLGYICPWTFFENTPGRTPPGLNRCYGTPFFCTSPTRIFCRGVSSFVTGCPCGVWGHGLTSALASMYVSSLINIHRPQKVYEHLHQRGISGKLHIGRSIYREPNILGWWNFAWFYIIWYFNRFTYGPK